MEISDLSSTISQKQRISQVYVLHFFRGTELTKQVGAILQGEVLPDAVDYFAGRGENAESDGEDFDFDEDELDEEGDDDEGSIDLGDEDEGPSKKKPKTA
jgi:hypothetical protein